jgi:hypothetical protein
MFSGLRILPALFISITASEAGWADGVTILNASYEPTRRFYSAVNKEFAKALASGKNVCRPGGTSSVGSFLPRAARLLEAVSGRPAVSYHSIFFATYKFTPRFDFKSRGAAAGSLITAWLVVLPHSSQR